MDTSPYTKLMRCPAKTPENDLLFCKWRKFSVENLYYFVHVAMRAHIKRKKSWTNYPRDALRKSVHIDSEAKHAKYVYTYAVKGNFHKNVGINQHIVLGKWAYIFPLFFLMIEIVGNKRSCTGALLARLGTMSHILNAYTMTPDDYESLDILARGSESSPARQI